MRGSMIFQIFKTEPQNVTCCMNKTQADNIYLIYLLLPPWNERSCYIVKYINLQLI